MAKNDHFLVIFAPICVIFKKTAHMGIGRTAAITAVGAYVPDEVLSNADLAQMVDTSDDWISTRTGFQNGEC